MITLSDLIPYIGSAVVVLGAALGLFILLVGAATALTWGFGIHLRRIGNVTSNWMDMVKWVRAGRPVWKLVDNPDRPGAQYQRMVPQDGDAIDIPEIVPVRVHERLDKALRVAKRMASISEDEEWSYVAQDLREIKDLLRK